MAFNFFRLQADASLFQQQFNKNTGKQWNKLLSKEYHDRSTNRFDFDKIDYDKKVFTTAFILYVILI